MKKNEIERLFNQDIREKKKTGSGSFKRAGKGVKNGIRGGMRFPYQNLSKKEQKEYTKPGEVKVFNLNDILPVKEFLKKPEKEQKELLIRWRDRYKGTEIIEKMGIQKNKYYSLVREFGLQEKKYNLNVKKKEIKPSLFEQYKEKIPDYQTFLGIERQQQIELFAYYDQEYTVEQLAEKMGTTAKTLYQLRYRINKYSEKHSSAKKEGEIKKDLTDDMFDMLDHPNLEVVSEVEQDDPSNEAIVKSDDKIPSIQKDFRQLSLEFEEENTSELKQTTTYIINGLYSGTEISKKLKKMSDLLLGETNQFDIQLTIHEIPNSNKNPEIEKEPELDKEKMVQALLKMLSGGN